MAVTDEEKNKLRIHLDVFCRLGISLTEEAAVKELLERGGSPDAEAAREAVDGMLEDIYNAKHGIE